MRLLSFAVAISLIIHLTVMVAIPSFGKDDDREVVPITIVVEEKKRPKQPVTPPKQQPKPKPVPTKPQPVAKPAPIPIIESTPAPAPIKPAEVAKPAPVKEVEKPVEVVKTTEPPKAATPKPVIPDIVIPKSSTEADIKAELPDVSVETTRVANNSDMGQSSVSQELAALTNNTNTASQNNALASEIEAESKAITNVYSIDISNTKELSVMRASNTREIVSVPASPSFSTELNTVVKLTFSINKAGVTSDIRVVGTSAREIERLAISYVTNMRFKAVARDGIDKGEVTLSFTVR